MFQKKTTKNIFNAIFVHTIQEKNRLTIKLITCTATRHKYFLRINTKVNGKKKKTRGDRKTRFLILPIAYHNSFSQKENLTGPATTLIFRITSSPPLSFAVITAICISLTALRCVSNGTSSLSCFGRRLEGRWVELELGWATD